MSLFNRRSRHQIQQHLSEVLQEPENVEDSSEDEEIVNEEEEERQPALEQGGDGDGNGRPPSRTHDPYIQGTVVVQMPTFDLKVKSVSHVRRTRYNLSDHLYSIWVEQKKRGRPPLLLDLEEALERAIILVLDELKTVYSKKDHQIYVTIIDRHITSGLNSGNYSLQTPSSKIARWMMSMLYNFLKSKQTLRLNKSFKVQVKVLSVSHTRDLEQNRPRFQRHVYH